MEKRTRTVRAAATVLMVPKVIAMIPKEIGKTVRDFKNEVRSEVNERVTLGEMLFDKK